MRDWEEKLIKSKLESISEAAKTGCLPISDAYFNLYETGVELAELANAYAFATVKRALKPFGETIYVNERLRDAFCDAYNVCFEYACDTIENNFKED